MKWRDSTLILGTRRLGESGLILSVLCSEMGRQAGFVPYGATRQKRPLFEAGNIAMCEWVGRLESHLGRFNVADITQAYACHILHRPLALKAFAAITTLLTACTNEGDRTVASLYTPTVSLLSLIKADEEDAYWPCAYARWEYFLLETLGFALDLDFCALSGEGGALSYISPKTGRGATERAAVASGYIQHLLHLPSFLLNHDVQTHNISRSDVLSALKLTGHFLQIRHFSALNQALPEPRRVLVEALDNFLKDDFARDDLKPDCICEPDLVCDDFPERPTARLSS